MQWHPTLPHHERPRAREPLPELGQSAEAPRPWSALDFDADQVWTAGEHEVDLVRPVPPTGQFHGEPGRVGEVRAYSALD